MFYNSCSCRRRGRIAHEVKIDAEGKNYNSRLLARMQQPAHGCVPNSPPDQVAHPKPAKVDPF